MNKRGNNKKSPAGKPPTPTRFSGNKYDNKEIGAAARHNTILNHITALFRDMDADDLPPLIAGHRKPGHAAAGARRKEPLPDQPLFYPMTPRPDTLFPFAQSALPAAGGSKPYTKSTRIEFLADFPPAHDQYQQQINATEQWVLMLLQRSI